MPKVLLGVIVVVLAGMGASHASAQSLQCELCGVAAIERELPHATSRGRFRRLSQHDLRVEERASLLEEREDTGGSAGLIVVGGIVGLAGLGGAAGIIAAWEQLRTRSDVTHPDGSVTEETSVAVGLGLLAVAGLIALGGLLLFMRGVQRRQRRRAIDEQVLQLDQQLSLAAPPLWW